MGSQYNGLAKILAIIGAILYLYSGIMGLVGGNIALGPIVNIILGIVVLIATGVVKSKNKIAFSGISLLIIAIVGILLGDLIASILVLIGAILLLV